MRNRLPIATLAALAASLLLAAGASAETRSFSNADNIRPADPISGAPGLDPAHYPSEITVAGAPGTITDVSVQLKGVGTAFTGDLDVLLVSPAGQAVMLMSDVSGRNPISFANLTFSDTGAAMPSADPISTGVFKPTNLAGDDDLMPRPAPAGPYKDTTMAAFDGAEPNGKWSLYVIDDAAGDENHVSLGWSLTLTTTGGKNGRDSTPNGASGRAAGKPPAPPNPSPATLGVSGVTQKIDRVTVTLHDIDI